MEIFLEAHVVETTNVQRDIVKQSYTKEKSLWKLVERLMHLLVSGTASGKPVLMRHCCRA